MLRFTFDASAAAASRRRLDDNGYLHVSGCPISSHGVFDYARIEAGLPGDPHELVKVLRPLEAVTSDAFLSSCQNVPLIVDHTYLEGLVQDGQDEPDGEDPSKKGVDGVLTNVRFDKNSGWVVGDLTVYSRAVIRQIMANKKTELSLGYTCCFTPVDGESHAATQTEMTCNHLALVDKARVPGARVLDAAFQQQSPEDDQMSKAKKAKALDGAAVEKLRELLLPALQQFLTEEAGEPEHQEEMATEPEASALEADVEGVDPLQQEAEAEVEGVEDGNDEAIMGLLQQLLSALQPAEEGGDAEPEEQEAMDNESSAEEKKDGKAMGMDSVFKAVAERDKLYGRVSKHTGAFDHAAMTAAEVAAYGCKKLGVKCKAGDSAIVLGAYLDGLETAAKTTIKVPAKVGDAARSDELDAYLSGKK